VGQIPNEDIKLHLNISVNTGSMDLPLDFSAHNVSALSLLVNSTHMDIPITFTAENMNYSIFIEAENSIPLDITVNSGNKCCDVQL
jgi:hypothetical protein